MMMENEILNQQEVCEYLKLPSIPKKQWDGKSLFEKGVATAELRNGDKAYVVVSHMEENMPPKVKKMFTSLIFTKITDVRPVPQYMESVDIQEADLDDESKTALSILNEESEELENSENSVLAEEDSLSAPANEYYFDNITNDDEAIAFIKAYNKEKGITGNVSHDHQKLIMRLSVIYAETNGDF